MEFFPFIDDMVISPEYPRESTKEQLQTIASYKTPHTQKNNKIKYLSKLKRIYARYILKNRK